VSEPERQAAPLSTLGEPGQRMLNMFGWRPPMKWLSWSGFVLALLVGHAYADEPATAKPLACPQCGLWQISSASAAGVAGEIAVIEGSRLIIPSCGIFDYETEKTTVTPRPSSPQPNNRYTYEISLRMTMRKPGGVCGWRTVTDWQLEGEVSGHFHEGGVAEFTVKQKRDDVLSFRAWNVNREDPCASGSGFGSGDCSAVGNGLLYKALAAETRTTYELARNIKPSRRPPSFNAARFAVTVATYCQEREKGSGGGSWPTAWALSCENEILSGKLREVTAWNACTQARFSGADTGTAKQAKPAPCSFTGERFDRTRRTE